MAYTNDTHNHLCPRLIVLVSTLAIALVSMLALPGCAGLGEPSSTESLLVRYAANSNNDNCTTRINVDLALSLVGYRVVIPVDANLDIAADALHGTVHADLSKLGCDDYNAEVYAKALDDHIALYVGARLKDGVSWSTIDIDTTASLDAFAATNLLSSATFNRIALDSDEAVSYELDIPTTTILDVAMGVLDKQSLPSEFDEKALAQMLEGEKLKSYFTKEWLLHSMSTMLMVSYAGEASNHVPVSIKAEVTATMDNYGGVDPASVAVPESVVSSAARTDLNAEDPFGVLAIIGQDNPLADRVGK